MTDPLTFAATEHDDREAAPDTTARGEEPDGSRHPAPAPAPDPAPAAPPAPATAPTPAPTPTPGIDTAAEPLRTLLETAATCRPVEEVTALVSLLKENGQQPRHGQEALRAAAVARPVHEVRRMVALLGEHPQEEAEADITLRAAAVGRPIEDVALLVGILGTEGPAGTYGADGAGPAGPGRPGAAAGPDAHPPGAAASPGPAAPAGPAGAGWPAGPAVPARPAAAAVAPVHPPGSRALRHVLRWPVAAALLFCGALHLPVDAAAPPVMTPADYLPLVVAVLCLGLGAVLAVRDTPVVWRSVAVAALGLVTLHVWGGVTLVDPLEGAVGGPFPWAGITAVLSAAACSLLAGVALTYRPARPGEASHRA
ncbi:hypothetical protein ACGFX2_29440 [Streptomyces goshikiensis]|uniref:hypothetical protein n=1 Tax=Streptomyces goshikiensis TaxID=1942 RepID=UPI0037138580